MNFLIWFTSCTLCSSILYWISCKYNVSTNLFSERIQDLISPTVEHDSHAERPRRMKKDTSGHKQLPRGSASKTLIIYLYSLHEANIEKAIMEIKKTSDAAEVTKILNSDYVMDFVANLPKDQVS